MFDDHIFSVSIISNISFVFFFSRSYENRFINEFVWTELTLAHTYLYIHIFVYDLFVRVALTIEIGWISLSGLVHVISRERKLEACTEPDAITLKWQRLPMWLRGCYTPSVPCAFSRRPTQRASAGDVLMCLTAVRAPYTYVGGLIKWIPRRSYYVKRLFSMNTKFNNFIVFKMLIRNSNRKIHRKKLTKKNIYTYIFEFSLGDFFSYS